MKIGLIEKNGTPVPAAFYGNEWLDLSKALAAAGKKPAEDLESFITEYNGSIPELDRCLKELMAQGKLAQFMYPQEGAKFLPPVPGSPKLFTGRGNSACFNRVNRSPICRQPVLEMRHNFNFVGHNSEEVIKKGFAGGGWNYEMICVMGKPCRNVSKEEAYDYVFGYTNMLDHSGRYDKYPYSAENAWGVPDSEKVFADWAYEGCYNGNTQVPQPIGPWIVTKDEVGDPHAQMLEERESGRLVSYGSANAVCFTFAETIEYLSSFLTLKPADMVNSASITYDGYPIYESNPEKAYIEANASKIGTLRLWLKDER